MKFIEGTDRKQAALFPVSLDDRIDQHNEVRAIDAFVQSLDLEKLGFKVHFSEGGRPAYHPALLIKLFIYGYMNRIRSSRMLERECDRNIELMWLLNSLVPDHNTIANFRKNNPQSIKRVFRATVELAKNHNLIGGRILAGDGTKLRAQNSKKNNYNKKKIERHLGYIDNKLDEYNKALAEADGDQEKQQINDEIDKHQGRRKNYENLQDQLDESGQDQISTSDPESRHMIIRGMITEVAYNIQSTVDAEHNLPIDYEVTNKNDSKAMGAMVRRAKTIIRKNNATLLFDKGYHTGSELLIAQTLGFKTLVAVPDPASNAPNPAYNVWNFEYNKTLDHYTCPEGHHLKSNGNTYTKHRGLSNQTSFKQYRTKACKNCPVRSQCTTAKNGKLIERNVYTPVFETNRANIEAEPLLYKRRQAIVEHPFGTIKRQWGFDHILTKRGRKSASADVGLIFIAYNLRRIWNITQKSNAMTSFWASILSFLGRFWHHCRAILNLNALKPLFQNWNLFLSLNQTARLGF